MFSLRTRDVQRELCRATKQDEDGVPKSREKEISTTSDRWDGITPRLSPTLENEQLKFRRRVFLWSKSIGSYLMIPRAVDINTL